MGRSLREQERAQESAQERELKRESSRERAQGRAQERALKEDEHLEGIHFVEEESEPCPVGAGYFEVK